MWLNFFDSKRDDLYQFFSNWRASKASETLSGLNSENRSYMFLYVCIICETSLMAQALHEVGRV